MYEKEFKPINDGFKLIKYHPSLQIAPTLERLKSVKNVYSFKNTLDYQPKKSTKCPILQAQFERKVTFFEFCV